VALKDITLGQYFPGNSLVHRLDPRTKIIAVVLYIVALFLAEFFVTYAIMLGLLAVSIRVSKVPRKSILGGLRPILFIAIFTAVLNLFYTPGEHVLLRFWIFTITLEGAFNAFFMVVRIMMLITGTFLLTYTTSPILLTDGLESLLNPLKKVKVPVHELSMMMSIALRFIPTLIEETDKIMCAQRARGADFESGNLLQRAKALIPLLVPLFISAFRRADELAVAMECRCYHGGEGRTRLRQLKYQNIDYLVLALYAVVLILVAILAHFGL
jgi:energy-coupling factor transport system permease protein